MFQQMKYFIAVVENHSFTRAAEECDISQSAISQQIKELEGSLGVALLNRTGRSFEVTEAGQYFYTHCQDVLEAVNQLVQNTIKITKDDEVELKVGYLRSFGTAEFLQTVSQFSQEYPKVKIKISSGTHEQLYELLRTEQVDLIFSDQRRALSNEYANEFLTDSQFMVAVSQTAFPGDANQIDAAQLVDIPCILITDNSQQANEKTYYREILGIKSEFQLVENYDEAQMMVASNQGYLIVNSRTESQLDTKIVKTAKLVNDSRELIQKYYAFWKADNSGFYIESFADLLKQSFA